jgi:hypothetical protein
MARVSGACEIISCRKVLEDHQFPFLEKETLGNGTVFSASVASLALHDTAHLALLAQVCTAIGTESSVLFPLSFITNMYSLLIIVCHVAPIIIISESFLHQGALLVTSRIEQCCVIAIIVGLWLHTSTFTGHIIHPAKGCRHERK